MHIYNSQYNSLFSHHILDPDHEYHTSYDAETLYPFFKSLTIPQNTKILAGIYIKYEITFFPFETYPFLYQKFSPHIQKIIIKYLDIGEAHLYHNQNDMFFIVMCDISEEQIIQAISMIHQSLAQKTFFYQEKNCQIKIKFGIYFSHAYIHPYDFYQCAQQQYENTLHYPATILSLKNFISEDVDSVHVTYKNNKSDF